MTAGDWMGVDPSQPVVLVVWLVSCLICGLAAGALLVALGAAFGRR
jgi:hypothetical protein